MQGTSTAFANDRVVWLFPKKRIPTALLVDQIGAALPAPSYAAIAARVNAGLIDSARYNPVNLQDIVWGIAYLRRRAAQGKLSWTIPHCRRGREISGDNRLYKLMVDRNGDFFAEEDGRHNQLIDGTIGSLSTVGQMMANHGAAIQMGIDYQYSAILKRELRSWLADMNYMAEKALALANALRDERATM